MTYQILKGNSLDLLPTLADNSIDAIVTDPPYELGFMGKTWDNSGIAYSLELWQQCLRVLKPGGHLLAFSGSRTYHRMVVSIEDAGFEIRDMISWISNKTFPKSLNIGKAIDKALGAERKVIGKLSNPAHSIMSESKKHLSQDITAPSSLDAQKWDGWGTGLKPTVEPIVMARKPVEGTVGNNVLTYGTGGLNIDASRIGADMSEFFSKTGNPRSGKGHLRSYGATGDFGGDEANPPSQQGRWPANLILSHTESCQPTGKTIKSKTGAGKRTATFGTQDTQSGGDGSGGWSGYEYETEVYECVEGCPVKTLDEQSGQSKSQGGQKSLGAFRNGDVYGSGKDIREAGDPGYGDSGGASRFFYVAKASKRDRNEGLEDLPTLNRYQAGGVGGTGGKRDVEVAINATPTANFHPTVKPTELMRYLVKLITPPGGTVLDPFTGSGSTGKAAILEGFDFIGIELTEDYWPIIEGRLKHAEAKVAERIKETSDQEQEKLF
jgi:site-specific DNA-methyltransferase (adenine-specific)